MRGIAADNRPQSLESLRQHEALFARATELDPNRGDAFERLARAMLMPATRVHAPSPVDHDELARWAAAKPPAGT